MTHWVEEFLLSQGEMSLLSRTPKHCSFCMDSLRGGAESDRTERHAVFRVSFGFSSDVVSSYSCSQEGGEVDSWMS